MRAIALKDCMEAIMFLWRLSGSTMQREMKKSRRIRNKPLTWKMNRRNSYISLLQSDVIHTCCTLTTTHQERQDYTGSTPRKKVYSKSTFYAHPLCCRPRLRLTLKTNRRGRKKKKTWNVKKAASHRASVMRPHRHWVPLLLYGLLIKTVLRQRLAACFKW